ncbi:signal recognition particle-docking protein FtsY [Litorivita sp. NS0012-18]|uniref:signal recognition particle-docking protein FtsY n=1 Tax=Litorivita sp. NS0012-18 TaxID=3127655 RepID=UPI00310C5F20
MAFFSKLKDRLFKSSSKLEQGLDAIVEDGGEEEVVAPKAAPEVAAQPAPQTAPETAPAPEPAPEPASGPEPAREADPAPVAEAQPAPAPQELPASDPSEAPSEAPEEAPAAPPAEVPAAPKEVVRPAQPSEQVPAEPPVEEPVEMPVEAPQPAPVEPQPAPVEVPAAPPAKALQEAPQEAPAPSTHSAQSAAAEAPRAGLIGRMLGRGKAAAAPQEASQQPPQTPAAKAKSLPALPLVTKRRVLDDDMLEQLEELLISADMGVDTALRVTANMAEGRFGKKLSADEIKRLLAAEVTRIMEPVARPMPIYPKRPQVVLVVGVNGSGKTTTIGKLASQFKAAGKSVVIAAGDTFRAAAVGQLQVWGERAGVPVLTAPEGSDPASLAFDAMTRAEAEGADLLMIDTAGRLQNRSDLMEELAKIVRVIRKKDPSAPHNTLLVLDATTGQNALSQVETFQKLADVTGLVMTKLDGTAKGGVLVALADKFGLPIHAIGVGEQIDDLSPFDPEDFAKALTGLDA